MWWLNRGERWLCLVAFLAFSSANGCVNGALPSATQDGPDGGTTQTSGEVPSTYDFASASYSGQIQRHALILELKGYIAGLTERIDAGSFEPLSADEVVDALDFYLRFDAESDGETPLTITAEPALAETSFNDIATKDLVGKLAGNDSATDHKCWTVSARTVRRVNSSDGPRSLALNRS